MSLQMMAVLLSAVFVSSKHHIYQLDPWPSVNVFTTFQANTSLYTWDGSSLSPLQDTTAVLLVDSTRNKAILHGKIQVPLFGSINADLLVDFTQALTLTYTPFLGLC